jgi:hypothetical protein
MNNPGDARCDACDSPPLSDSGTACADADGNENGIIDAADYTIWRDKFGAGSGSLTCVPEPSTWLLVAGLVGLVDRRGRFN